MKSERIRIYEIAKEDDLSNTADLYSSYEPPTVPTGYILMGCKGELVQNGEWSGPIEPPQEAT